MQSIPLSKGLSTLVADEDYETLSKWKWHAHKASREGANYYAARSAVVNGKRKTIFMHSQIMGGRADHINMDTLDNRRQNLRPCTHAQNMQNRRSYGKIKFKGVFQYKGRYRAAIQVNGKRQYLGYFDTPEDAAAAYNKEARKLHGEFAYLNAI